MINITKTKRDFVTLVNRSGQDLLNPDGTLMTVEKLQAHRQGLLHRAVSVFSFNNKGELLIQKRAPGKYHSANLWSNTCCTHPFPQESPNDAAHRRLYEEMGLSMSLSEISTFKYQVEVGNGLVENEFDHIFLGYTNQNPVPDPGEVSEWAWVGIEKLKKELYCCPSKYSAWFPLSFCEVIKHEKVCINDH